MVSQLRRLLVASFVSCIGLVVVDADTSSKTSYQHYAITGVHTGVNAISGARPARQPIQVMQNDPITLYAFLLSLTSIADRSHAAVLCTSSPSLPCKVLHRVT